MDATFHIKKLDISIFRHNLHSAKERIFEKSGKINKVWALSIFFNPEISFIRYSNPIITGLHKPALMIQLNEMKMNLLLLTIKDKRI